MTTVPALLHQAASQWPARTALVDASGRTTYRELEQRVRALTDAIQARWRLGKGEAVALLAPNSTWFVTSYFGISAAGGAVLPVDDRLKGDEMAFLLNDARVRCAIVHEAFRRTVEGIRKDVPALEQVLGIGWSGSSGELSEWTRAETAPPLNDPSPDALAEVLYTSGTTGRPKGVMRSHANVRAASANAIKAFGYRHEDVIAIVMPLSHSSALVSQLLPILERGGTAVLIERFDGSAVLEAMQRNSVTCLRAVPAMFRMLLAQPNFNHAELPSLRLLMNSSAPLDEATFRRVKERFPTTALVNSYGLTEASTSTILSDADAARYPGSIGAPISGVEMCVVDDQGSGVQDGTEGEFWVRGPHVFVGYLNLPDETRAAFAPGGWLRTGDFGIRDERGFYFFHGRKDEVINCGGRKYGPVEVESCIAELPEVREVAVVPVPHRVLGQVPKAYVVFHEGVAADTRAVSRHCSKRLPSYKVPFFVEAVPALPRNSVGKILNRKLRSSEASAKETES